MYEVQVYMYTCAVSQHRSFSGMEVMKTHKFMFSRLVICMCEQCLTCAAVRSLAGP